MTINVKLVGEPPVELELVELTEEQAIADEMPGTIAKLTMEGNTLWLEPNDVRALADGFSQLALRIPLIP